MSPEPDGPTAPGGAPETQGAIPAGWYPDPAGSFQQRWWNGTAWTNDFAQFRPTIAASHNARPAARPAAAATSSDSDAVTSAETAVTVGAAASSVATGSTTTVTTPPVTTPPVPVIAPAPQLPPGYGPLVAAAPAAPVTAPVPSSVVVPVSSLPRSATPVNPSLTASYRPFDGPVPTRAQARRLSHVRHTAAAWVVALLPLVPVPVATALALLVPEYYGLLPFLVVVVVTIAVAIGTAAADRFRLVDDGHETLATPAFAILPPVYLAVRSALVRHHTGTPTPSLILVSVLAILAPLAAVIAVPGLRELLLG